jgi:SAM-dependent methyltransferase
MECPVCSSDSFIKQLDFYDDRYGYKGMFDLFKCSCCSHRSLQCHLPPELLRRLYTDYYPRSTFDIDRYKASKDVNGFGSLLNGEACSAYAWVPKDVRILDIGCGFCETLGYHRARGCDAYGVEADENIQHVAEKFGFNVHIGLFDPNLYEPNYFDYVTLDQVIEHIAEPLKTMLGISRVLKPGGTAIISTPNANGWGAKLFGRRWINWHAPYHINFFSHRSMQIAAEQAGLSIEKKRTLTSSEWLFYQWIHLVSYPDIGETSGFWSPRGKYKVWQGFFVKLLIIMHKTKINHLITRIFDFLGIGDNYIFILRKAK